MDTRTFYEKDEMNNLLTPTSPGARPSDVWGAVSEDSDDDTNCCLKFLKSEWKDVTSLSFWQACMAEFVGLFLLCFYTIGVGLSEAGERGPSLLHSALGVGFFLVVIISALANVSGGHVNPAVTLGFAITRQISIFRMILYIVFQCAGAYSGTLVLKIAVTDNMVGTLGVIAPPTASSMYQVVAMEAMITGMLNFVVMAMTDKGRKDIGGSVPLVVGFTVVCNILLAANVSGGCMNPARASGPAIFMGKLEHIWMYWLGPCLGGVAGALLYYILFRVGASPRNYLPCKKEEPKKDNRVSVALSDPRSSRQVYA